MVLQILNGKRVFFSVKNDFNMENGDKMKEGKKGAFHYIKNEKKRRILKTLLLFTVPVIALIIGILIYKTKTNIVTVIAVVGMLPGCKSLVGTIMIFMYQSMDEEKYRQVEEKRGSLTMVYEMVLTTYEKNTYVDTFAICGNQVIGYSGDKKIDLKYVEEHTQKILHHNGYKVKVKIFKDFQPFLDRIDSLNEHADSLRADIPFTPDEHYPDLGREEMIKHTILAISL